jgi:aldehyde:ferredoxin oxidoreductase
MHVASGKLLSADLDSQHCTVETVPETRYRKYLGGYGLGVALLLERNERPG